jgi:hypothetical protein
MARSDRVEHPNPADSANRPVQPENPDRPVFRLTVMLKPERRHRLFWNS